MFNQDWKTYTILVFNGANFRRELGLGLSMIDSVSNTVHTGLLILDKCTLSTLHVSFSDNHHHIKVYNDDALAI